jgi:hypothetical protein
LGTCSRGSDAATRHTPLCTLLTSLTRHSDTRRSINGEDITPEVSPTDAKALMVGPKTEPVAAIFERDLGRTFSQTEVKVLLPRDIPIKEVPLPRGKNAGGEEAERGNDAGAASDAEGAGSPEGGAASPLLQRRGGRLRQNSAPDLKVAVGGARSPLAKSRSRTSQGAGGESPLATLGGRPPLARARTVAFGPGSRGGSPLAAGGGLSPPSSLVTAKVFRTPLSTLPQRALARGRAGRCGACAAFGGCRGRSQARGCRAQDHQSAASGEARCRATRVAGARLGLRSWVRARAPCRCGPLAVSRR